MYLAASMSLWRINNNYEWMPKYTISFKMIPSIYCQPVAFHPYDDTIFLSKHNTELIVKYHFGTQKLTNRDFLKLVYPACTSRFVFPFLRCEVPFVWMDVELGTTGIPSHFHLLYVWFSFLSWWLTLTYISNLHFQYIYTSKIYC